MMIRINGTRQIKLKLFARLPGSQPIVMQIAKCFSHSRALGAQIF